MIYTYRSGELARFGDEFPLIIETTLSRRVNVKPLLLEALVRARNTSRPPSSSEDNVRSSCLNSPD